VWQFSSLLISTFRPRLLVYPTCSRSNHIPDLIVVIIMSVAKEFEAANEKYAASFTKGDLVLPPQRYGLGPCSSQQSFLTRSDAIVRLPS
jgi:hypothetical protein